MVDDLLLKYNQICRLYRPPDRAYAQVFHWMLGNKMHGSGHNEFDHDFINYRDDMVYVVDHQQQADGFDRIIEWCCRRWPASFLQVYLCHIRTFAVNARRTERVRLTIPAVVLAQQAAGREYRRGRR
jgi:hypothetical protein